MRTCVPVLAIMLVLAACSVAPAPAPTASTTPLVDRHDELWKLMGLSDAARSELNGLVRAVQGQLDRNRKAHPELFDKAPERAPRPTHDEYIAAHKRRFDALKISAPTQQELLRSAEFIWKCLHDPDVAEKDRRLAMKIRDLMKSGPPPCCDDAIFRKAGAQ